MIVRYSTISEEIPNEKPVPNIIEREHQLYNYAVKKMSFLITWIGFAQIFGTFAVLADRSSWMMSFRFW